MLYLHYNVKWKKYVCCVFPNYLYKRINIEKQIALTKKQVGNV